MADMSTSGGYAKKLRENTLKWDAATECTAPLTDRQRDSVLELTSTINQRPLSSQLKDEDSETTRITLPDMRIKQKSDLLDTLCSSTITNTQQFYSWFCDIQTQMEEDDEIHHKQFIQDLEKFHSQCDGLVEEVSGSINQLNELGGDHEFVSTKTNTLHQSCEHLLEEQTSLMNVAEAIQSKLSYFNELDRINSKLGAQSLTVSSEGFIPMLARLDECITYVQSNPRYKDSPLFLTKFHLASSKALSLVKSHVSTLLTNATHNVQSAKGSTPVSDDAFTLFYGKFRTNAPRVKALIEQIERRVDKNESYNQLLMDCHQCYVTQREALVEPSVSAAVIELTLKHKTDHCALMRSGCALMVHICEDEYQLYQHFFTKPSDLLDDFLERLCNYLYDAFRPLIIHINHMETLSELCSILKIEMLEDHVYNNPRSLRAFERVALQMLQDVQERLVYRTYIYINSDILNYKPAAGDLAYPDKLQMMQSIAESMRQSPGSRLLSTQRSTSSMNSSTASLESQEVEAIVSGAVSGSPINGATTSTTSINGGATHTSNSLSVSANSSMPMSPADLHGMWYPTVRKTVVCLSKLSRCIDSTTFQGLSQEALTLCIKSLQHAKTLISSKRTVMDGQLFYIKHLLIIREQISPFQAPFSVTETQLEFSHIKDAALGLVKSSSDLFKFNSNNSLLKFLFDGTPQAVEHSLDSKQEVDQQLKISCAEFIDKVSSQLLAKIQDFINKVEVMKKLGESSGGASQLTSQPFAKPEAVRELTSESYRILKSKAGLIYQSMSLYLANRETEAILFKPIKSRVQRDYQTVLDLVNSVYNQEERQIIGCPTMEQVTLVLSTLCHAAADPIKYENSTVSQIDMYSSVISAVLTAGCLFGVVLSQDGDYWDLWWSYQPGVSGPSSWGSFNPKYSRCGTGRRQSPIDIAPSDLLYDPNLKHISLSKHKVAGKLMNTGHDLTVILSSRTGDHSIILSEGPLSYKYRVDRIIIHFGESDRKGSEHRIDSKTFPAEIQMYAYNTDLYSNYSDAEEKTSGLAAISLMVSVNDSISNAMEEILSDTSSVQYRGGERALTKFSVHNLLPDTLNYMTYEGSLTKPGCYETVTWIIMNKPVYMSGEQMSLLRQTVSTDSGSIVKSPLENNNRPVQSVNRRPVRTNINFPLQEGAQLNGAASPRPSSIIVMLPEIYAIAILLGSTGYFIGLPLYSITEISCL